MAAQMIEVLSPKDGGVYVDATFGGGGYARAILAAADCKVIGIDRDPAAYARGQELALVEKRFDIIEGVFSDIVPMLRRKGLASVDGIVADIGVSSYQLDQSARGFSFRNEGPLDMRMSQTGVSAADIVNSWDAEDLARLFRKFGEEPEAWPVAKAIAARRAKQPFGTTRDLAATVGAAKRQVKPGRDPATQVFQALRMEVNNELGELESLLSKAQDALAPGGRLVIVSFHSLEDRLVKTAINRLGGRLERPSRYVPDQANVGQRVFEWAHRKPIFPSKTEIEANPRARSARLRVAVRQPSALPANNDQESDTGEGVAA